MQLMGRLIDIAERHHLAIPIYDNFNHLPLLNFLHRKWTKHFYWLIKKRCNNR